MKAAAGGGQERFGNRPALLAGVQLRDLALQLGLAASVREALRIQLLTTAPGRVSGIGQGSTEVPDLQDPLEEYPEQQGDEEPYYRVLGHRLDHRSQGGPEDARDRVG